MTTEGGGALSDNPFMNFPKLNPQPFRIDPQPVKDAAALAKKVKELPAQKVNAARDRFETAVKIATDPYGSGVLTCPPVKTAGPVDQARRLIDEAIARLPKPG